MGTEISRLARLGILTIEQEQKNNRDVPAFTSLKAIFKDIERIEKNKEIPMKVVA